MLRKGSPSDWSRTKLSGDNINNWTAEELLGKSGIYCKGVVYQPKDTTWKIEKYGAMYLEYAIS
ncbi:MAG: hypothetical protein MRQ09_04580 [Candidatus Midichloria sp.]|nr:hypothetical protein [Candidatus Midichloria sp.]